jgi:hypothetical protein
MNRRSAIIPIVLLLAAMLLPYAAGACPMCKEAYSDGTGASVGASFNPSILFMIAVTFAVVSGVSLRIWWSYRGRDAARQTKIK